MGNCLGVASLLQIEGQPEMDAIYWFAVGSGVVALLYGVYAIRSVLAASAVKVEWYLALAPALPGLLALTIAGLVAITFRRSWQEGRDELRAAELE